MRSASATLSAVIVAMTLTSNAWSQPNVTLDSPYQLHYFTGLNVGDSLVNIINTGARGADGPGVGDICGGVYTFNPDGTLAACCSCLIGTNALRSLSVVTDLISNTLTPLVPSSVVVKLLASAPVGGACDAAAPGALSSGLLAWGTTRHVTTSTTTTRNTSSSCVKYCQGTYPPYASWCANNCAPKTQTTTTNAVTETPFLPATLSAGELAKLTDRCTDIQQNGGGFGICSSCRLGGQ